MKTWALGTILLLALAFVLLVAAVRGRAAPPPPLALAAALSTSTGQPGDKAPEAAKEAVPAPTPVPVADASRPADPLADELTALLGTFVPAWGEHESSDSLARRRAELGRLMADAARASFPDDPALGRRYAVTLAFLGQRETRYAINPRVLGSEDNGQAHGSWQVHEWHGMNPYLATTAMAMLKDAPESWSLPRGTPWVGYPPAARYLEAHP